MPTGLFAGINNFYAPQSGGAQGQFTSSTPVSLAVTRWQGVTVTGLSAGIQSYTISGMNTVNWSDWNSSQNNWTGTVNIPQASVDVPEPASLALVALGLLGLGLRRRQQA